MNENNPLVSIIIPTYNRADLIVETLQSVQNQTYQNWECIVVDDGSTDGTENVMAQFYRHDYRFSFHKNNSSKGAPGARNTGAKLSKGEFLVFMDSDDLLAKDCLLYRMEKMRSHPDFDFLVFSTVEFEKRWDDRNILWNVNTTDDIIIRFLNMDVPWIIMAPIWKRKSFFDLGLWNERILSLQDWDFHIRAILKGYNYLYFSQVDNFVRRDNDLETIGKNAFSKEHLNSHLNLFQDLKILMAGNPHYKHRLNGLAFWIGEEALRRGYPDVAKMAVSIAQSDMHFSKRIVNYISITVFRKLFIKYPIKPDFGITRKVYAPIY